MSTERARQIVFQVLRLVAPGVEPERFDPAASLRAQAQLEPEDFAEFVALLSDALHGEIPHSEHHQLETIDSTVTYLASRLG